MPLTSTLSPEISSLRHTQSNIGFSSTECKDEQTIDELLKELVRCANQPLATAVLHDAIAVLENRALARFDPLNGDAFVEQRIRDTLFELMRSDNEKTLYTAVCLIEALLDVSFTSAPQKFGRLCRSLVTIMQCGIENSAYAAQRVFIKLLSIDASADELAPVREIVCKELSDRCEVARNQLRGRVQQFGATFSAQHLFVMLASAATAEAQPRYLSAGLRGDIVALATVLSGSPDTILRTTAYNCLVAVFKNTSGLRSNEIVLEGRRICEEAIRSLNTSHNNEGHIASTLQALRALFSSRGVQTMDKQLVPQLCVLVTEQRAVSKSPLARAAICNLVPVIAEVDIMIPARRTMYCAVIMEPVKNVREESSKSEELSNVASFIRHVGYDIFDPTNRINLDSILTRYVARPQTQEQCWNVIAAICGNLTVTCRPTTASLAQQKHHRVSHAAVAGLADPRTPFTASPVAKDVDAHDVVSQYSATQPSSSTRHDGAKAIPAVTPTMSQSNSVSSFQSIATTVITTRPDKNSMHSPSVSPGASTVPHNIEDLIRRCIPHLINAVLTSKLTEYIDAIAQRVPSVQESLIATMNRLVDRTICTALSGEIAAAGKRTGQPSEGASGSMSNMTPSQGNFAPIHRDVSLPSLNASSVMTPSASVSSMAQPYKALALPAVLGLNTPTTSSPNSSTAPPGYNANTKMAQSMYPVYSPRKENPPTGPQTNASSFVGGGTGVSSPNASVAASPVRAPLLLPIVVGPSHIKVALEVIATRPITAVNQLEEIKCSILPLQRHADASVRIQCSKAVVSCLSNWLTYATSHKTSTYSTRVTEIMDIYVRHVTLDFDPKSRQQEIAELVGAPDLWSILSEQRIVTNLASFLNDDNPIRAKTVELLVSIGMQSHSSQSSLIIDQSLFTLVDSSTIIIEYSTETNVLLRHMADVQMFTKLGVAHLCRFLSRIFTAFNRRLREDCVSDVIALTILTTLHCILEWLTRRELSILKYQDEVAEIYPTVVQILTNTSTTPPLSRAAICVLVGLNDMGASPETWNSDQLHKIIKAIISVYIGHSKGYSRDEQLHILTLMGQVGAIDPGKKATTITEKKRKDVELAIQDDADLELTYDYGVIVYRTLSRMLDLSLSEPVCIQAMRTLLNLVRMSNDKKEIIGGAHAVKAVLKIAKRANESPTLRIEALNIITGLTHLRYERISKTLLPEIVVLLEQLWNPSELALFRAVLDLVNALKPGALTAKEHLEIWPWLYPRLVDAAVQDTTATREFSVRILVILLSAAFIPMHCIPLVVPMLVSFMSHGDHQPGVAVLATCTAVHIVSNLKAVQHLSTVLHALRTLTRHCQANPALLERLATQQVRDVLKVLVAQYPNSRSSVQPLKDLVVEHLERAVSPRSPGLVSPITLGPASAGHPGSVGANFPGSRHRKTSGSKSLAGMDYVSTGGGATATNTETMSNATTSTQQYAFAQVKQAGGNPGIPAVLSHGQLSPDHSRALPSPQSPQGPVKDFSTFLKHVELGYRVREKGWRDWFFELQRNIMIVSPNPAFSQMVDLFDKHEPLRRELFNPSFKCLYESLNADHIKMVNEVLTLALASSDSEVVSKCLGLADYLDHNPPAIEESVQAELQRMQGRNPNQSQQQQQRFSAASYGINSPSAATKQPLNADGEKEGATPLVPGVGLRRTTHTTTLTDVSVNTSSSLQPQNQNQNQNVSSRRDNHMNLAIIPPGADFDSSGLDDINRGQAASPTMTLDASDQSLDARSGLKLSGKGAGRVDSPSSGMTLAESNAQRPQPQQQQQRNLRMKSPDPFSLASMDEGAFMFDSPPDIMPSTLPQQREKKPGAVAEATREAGNDPDLLERLRPLDRQIERRTSSLLVSSQKTTEDYSQSSPVPCSTNQLFNTDNLLIAAERNHMYDKAMGYMENKLYPLIRHNHTGKLPHSVIRYVVWPLAWLYSKRDMQDSVVGLFRSVKGEAGMNDGFGFELLQSWEDAQLAYARAIRSRPKSFSEETMEGYIRTLCLCGQWNKALDVAKRVMAKSELSPASSIPQSGATAAWIMKQWDDVRFFADRISVVEKGNSPVKFMFLTGHLFHELQTQGINKDILVRCVQDAKWSLDESLKTLLPLSYSHAYENMTMLQHFCEFEECLRYNETTNETLRCQLRAQWKRRFFALKPDTLWPSLHSLMVHSLVLSNTEMSESIIHFCETMRPQYPGLSAWAMELLQADLNELSSQGMRSASQRGKFPSGDIAPTSFEARGTSPSGGGLRTIDSKESVGYGSLVATPRIPLAYHMVSSPVGTEAHPEVGIGYITNLWNEGKNKEAVQKMETFLSALPNLELEDSVAFGNANLKLGLWKQELFADSFWKRDCRDGILQNFRYAIRATPESFDAWHNWGLTNYRTQQRDHTLTLEERRAYVDSAHQGFVGAICRSEAPSRALSGIMRLLQLWVLYDGVSMMKESVADSIERIPVDYWVQAIPQLIGHLNNDSHDVREAISTIIKRLCAAHSQAVVFPLLVPVLSDTDNPHQSTQQQRRSRIAENLLQFCPKRIRNDAETVAAQLISISAIPIERIKEHLSAVATAWNPNAEYEEDPEDVKRHLESALQIFRLNERHLLNTVGKIGYFVQTVIELDARGEREKASGIVGQLVDEISKHIGENLNRELKKPMNPLVDMRNLSICVFGEYDIYDTSYPTIASFSSKLDVIPSKKRPRRLRLNGSDGCLYTYCLKGNEDIRMDERVMQLFGMVNAHLNSTRIPSSAYIYRFPVITINSNVGLLGWVENAETINNTICSYRNTVSHLRTNHESSTLRSYLDSVGKWDHLTIAQRAEILEYVMESDKCEAVDVSRSLWQRANTAEQWIERRTCFTQSLATMSIVGYILGLGDRHLGNILLSMSTGKIVHIDFGDSFDVGRLRYLLPETIPFRLTRMLTNAMEIFGVDGIFRSACTRTLGRLHRHRDSIMALLSSFVYDPIVQHKGKMKNMMEKSRSSQDVVERIRNKLRGMELAVHPDELRVYGTVPDSSKRPDLLYMSLAFDDEAKRLHSMAMQPDEQVDMLINEATRIDNYTTLYFGWGPLW